MKEIHYWLALWHISGVGHVHFARLLEHFCELKNVFEASYTELQSLKLNENIIRFIQNPDWKTVEWDMRWCENKDCRIITLKDPTYPKLLKEIPDPPPLLFVQGQVETLSLPQLAMVGSRHPSKMGIDTAQQFAHQLAQAGLAITSGLAQGIDSASHRGALDAGGKTIAVLGNGLNHVYPPQNRKLAQQIVQSGALVSEFPLDMLPVKNNFPRRNRIVSGLSVGTLVVEATLKSGSLITAHLANEQNREVFAIPGSIHHQPARGCHLLIRRGAKLVESVADILEELPTRLPSRPMAQAETAVNVPLAENYHKLLECIGYEATSIDCLAQRYGQSPQVIASMLLILELKNYIYSVPGGYIRK